MDAVTCKAICRARLCPAANPPVWTKHGIKFDSLLKREETAIQSAHTHTRPENQFAREGGAFETCRNVF